MKRLSGTRLRAPLLLKSSIITSSPPRAGILSALVLRRSAGRERGSLCYGSSRSSLLLSCVGLARATGAASRGAVRCLSSARRWRKRAPSFAAQGSSTVCPPPDPLFRSPATVRLDRGGQPLSGRLTRVVGASAVVFKHNLSSPLPSL